MDPTNKAGDSGGGLEGCELIGDISDNELAMTNLDVEFQVITVGLGRRSMESKDAAIGNSKDGNAVKNYGSRPADRIDERQQTR
jgi:hypothetical protein